MKGDIPAIRVKRNMSETDINTYNIIKNSATPDMNSMIDLVFNDIDFVIEGVRARMEWLALQLISSGRISFTKTTNNGVVTETAIDYGMSSSYKSGAAVVWSAAVGTTTPITDIETITQAAILRGIVLKYILMDRQSWLYLRASTETTNFMAGYSFAGLAGLTKVPKVSLAMVNMALLDNQLPQIIIVDQSIITETDAHVQTAANPFHAGHICFIPDLAVGDMLYGPIAEETNPPKQVVQAKTDNILVSRWSNVDPVIEWTKGESNVFPVWPLIDQCYLLDTLNATDWTAP